MAKRSLGISRARLGPAAAIIDPRQGVAACEENRLTRARQAPTSGPPDLAIAELLSYLRCAESDIDAVGVVRDEEQPDWWKSSPGRLVPGAPVRHSSSVIPASGGGGGLTPLVIDAHLAHAEYAFQASGFDSALVVVADATTEEGYSAWMYERSDVVHLRSPGSDASYGGQGGRESDVGRRASDVGRRVAGGRRGSGAGRRVASASAPQDRLGATADKGGRGSGGGIPDSRPVRRQDSVGDFPIARVYGAMTEALGFRAARDEHLVEAMARAGRGDGRAADWIGLAPQGMSAARDFQQAIADVCNASGDRDATCRDVAATVQRKLGTCLTELLSRLASASGARRLCLSGGLFFNTHFTTTAAHSGAFDEVFVPAHPGRSGASLGAALLASNGDRTSSTFARGDDMRATADKDVGRRASSTFARGDDMRATADKDVGESRDRASRISSAYLGPGYTDADIKEALENCKLAYDLQREEQVIETVLRALSRGRLVGWFHGRLEWGPRALGHRTVLADPFSPHVLDNLNGYLKKRPSYRSYGISVPLSKLHDLFDIPRAQGTDPSPSPFMQYEYHPRDLDKFRTILPDGVETLRVHTVDESEPRYLRLLEKWGEMSGAPVLVNTSFNGFHEPLVCSPRDAIRVFYGTGLDLLALEDFVLKK